MGTEPATEARRKHHCTPEIQAAVAKACRRRGGLRAAWRAGMFGEISYGILRCEAEKLGLMRARAGSSCIMAEDAILDPLAGVASLETIRRKLARAWFHRSLGAMYERCWALGESSRQGDWRLNEVTEGIGVDWHTVRRWERRASSP